MGTRKRLTGWGRNPASVSEVFASRFEPSQVASLQADPRGWLARGWGRSYGDAALNAGGSVLEASPDQVELSVAGDGTIEVGAAVTLEHIISQVLPQGYFVPVTPGTRLLTVGGAFAADIHGKNHHQDGSFANHVEYIDLALPGAKPLRLTPKEDTFWATAGGMGLTGIITKARIKLLKVESSKMRVDTQRSESVQQCMQAMLDSDHEYRYSVAWIDVSSTGKPLGRTILTRANHASAQEAKTKGREVFDHKASMPLRLPDLFPNGLINRLTVRGFNELWYRKSPRKRSQEIQGITQYFHPLDFVGNWNRAFGARGFLQHQFVVPFGNEELLLEILKELAASGKASILAVLKTFGTANKYLSFPSPGWTLALDLFVGPDMTTLARTLDEIDDKIADVGGRIYLAKDSRARAETVHRMYPQLDEFRLLASQLDPDQLMNSDLNRRLHLR